MFYFCCTGENATKPRLASYFGEINGMIDLPNKYNSFTQPDPEDFRTRVSTGPVMFLDMLSDGSETGQGIQVYVNLFIDGMLINKLLF